MSKEATLPTSSDSNDPRVHVTVAATWKDPKTGALYVHQDLARVQEPWAEEAHVSPMKVCEAFGDVNSFVAYVKRFGDGAVTHLTWNNQGLHAVLDYASDEKAEPGRCQWRATLPFRLSSQWQQWMAFANNSPLSQKVAVEKLEDLAADIVDPHPSELMGILRGLRAMVNAQADAEFRPDGTTSVQFTRDTKVHANTSVELPHSFTISIPVLRGHEDSDGRQVVYGIPVRVRVSVEDGAKLALRFAIPTAERVLEDVYALQVANAKQLFGDEYSLLRASDN